MENILGGAHMNPVSNVTSTKDGTSLNVRTVDNTTMGSVTITPTDSVRQQLANLPDDVQNKLLQTLAYRKLQEEATSRVNQTPAMDNKDANNFIQTLIGSAMNVPQQQANASQTQTPAQNIMLGGGQPMHQNEGMDNANVDLLFQTYLGDQDQNMSFDSFGSNLGNLNFDPSVAAMVNVSSDQGIDETRAAIQSLNQS
jgi:hypothetical protein